MTSAIKVKKVNRIRLGEPPRVLDLFAGCGGLSLGFHTAGFEIVGAVEIDPCAAKSHSHNFFKTRPHLVNESIHVERDITQIEPNELLKDFKPSFKPAESVDVIIGGPPCQAFARVGRAKLREVMDDPFAFKQDPRANLYLRYLHYVQKLQPVAILIENVPDILNFGGHNIAEEICETLSGLGYVCRYTLLNSVHYGVPQMRERMFLIAYSKELQIIPTFPKATNWIEIPRGYVGTRHVALKHLEIGLFGDDNFYTEPPEISKELPAAITAKEALQDLPRITYHLMGKAKKMPQRFDNLMRYPEGVSVSKYGQTMRSWKGFESVEGIKDHVIRYLPRDYAIFKRMRPGDQYPEAFAIANEMLQERLMNLKHQGFEVKEGSDEYEKLKKEIVPPYDPGKFPNKWRKMESDMPARTLMAHLGKDGYSHIHYDSEQARTISVREAARLMSFPDGFVFAGSMNAAFRQIGNAVPPLLSLAIANEIKESLGGYQHGSQNCSQETYSI